jgi:hypothetical protein
MGNTRPEHFLPLLSRPRPVSVISAHQATAIFFTSAAGDFLAFFFLPTVRAGSGVEAGTLDVADFDISIKKGLNN